MKKQTKKSLSKVWEEAIINQIEDYKDTHKKCEACGAICLTSEMEVVNIDEERTPALVCGKCYFGAEEKADEHNEEYDIDPGEYEEEPLPTIEKDGREEALDDLANGKW